MNLRGESLEIFREIYFHFLSGGPMQEGFLEVMTGKSKAALRPYLEDLKNSGYLIERDGRLEPSNTGKNEARSIWP